MFGCRFADGLIEGPENLVATNDERHVRAERMENLSHLDGDVAGADNDRFPLEKAKLNVNTF